MAESPEIVKTTCPRDCYDACGIAVAKRGGKIWKVLGDPSHAISRGVLCGKCAIVYNGAWRDPKLRLSQPLRRAGAKGEGRFEAVSWDTALADIAARCKAAIAAGHARRIIHSHYTGTVGLIAGWFPLRLFQRMGATEVDPDTVCNKAGHAALGLVFGDSLEGFDPRTVADAKTIVIWGANPFHSAPHQHKGWLARAREAGTKLVVVDPIAHGTAKTADLHLQLFPGSDSALIFGLLHVIRAAGLVDEAFLAAHVLGADALLPAIEAMTPERTAELTGVPVAHIEAAARAYAAGPSLLWLGQGVQRQRYGGNVFRAAAALVAFTGNLGKPGAGFLYMNGPASRGIDMATLTQPDLAKDGTGAVSHMELAATLEDPAKARIFFNWNCNPAASSPEQGRLRRALAREDLFQVTIDLFQTDTGAYADYLLPAASFLEFDDLVVPYFDLTLSAQAKAGDPPGEALANQEIFRRLAAAMGYEDEALFETDEALLARLMAQTPFAQDFAALAKLGTAVVIPEPKVQFADLKFATPSGRIELLSEQAEAQGLPRLPEPVVDTRPSDGRLRVLSPASLWLMNSSYGNDPKIQAKLGEPTVLLHADDAAARGLADGEMVEVANATGRLTLKVKITPETQPGVAIIYKGRWPSSAPDRANVNALFDGTKSDIAESTTVHGTEVALTRAHGPKTA